MPAGFTATTSQTNALITRGYYIASQSSQLGLKGQTIPSLHRKSLSSNPIGVIDEEILAGVEDLQIELGVDTDIPDAAFSMGVSTGSVQAFHFDIVSVGKGPRNASSTHTQSFYQAGPGGQ